MSDKTEVIAAVGAKATYAAGGTTSVFGYFTANEIAAYGGLILGFLTFVVSTIYKHKHYQLAKAKSEPHE